jgi:hypothetical protein
LTSSFPNEAVRCIPLRRVEASKIKSTEQTLEWRTIYTIEGSTEYHMPEKLAFIASDGTTE